MNDKKAKDLGQLTDWERKILESSPYAGMNKDEAIFKARTETYREFSLPQLEREIHAIDAMLIPPNGSNPGLKPGVKVQVVAAKTSLTRLRMLHLGIDPSELSGQIGKGNIMAAGAGGTIIYEDQRDAIVHPTDYEKIGTDLWDAGIRLKDRLAGAATIEARNAIQDNYEKKHRKTHDLYDRHVKNKEFFKKSMDLRNQRMALLDPNSSNPKIKAMSQTERGTALQNLDKEARDMKYGKS